MTARTISPEFRSVENTSGGDLAKGTIVKLAATGTDGLPEVATCGAGNLAYGVLTNDIANGDIGLCQVRGVAPTLAAGTLTIGAECASDAAGKAVDAGTSARVVGTTLTNPGTGLLAEVDLAALGGDTHA